MSIGQSIGKGFRFFLMSMGVSTYPRRTLSQPDTKPGTRPEANLKANLDTRPVPVAGEPPAQPK